MAVRAEELCRDRTAHVAQNGPVRDIARKISNVASQAGFEPGICWFEAEPARCVIRLRFLVLPRRDPE